MWPGAFPKTPASQRLTPLGSLPRTLDQKKLISKVIPWGGPLSLSAWDCRISWDSRLSGLNSGKSQANLDKLVTLLPQYFGDEQSLGLSRTTNFFFSYLATIYWALPLFRQDHSLLASSPLTLTGKWGRHDG